MPPPTDCAMFPLLPVELLHLVIQNSSDATLAAWACVSEECWKVACPILWSNLSSAVPLLALLDQRDEQIIVSSRLSRLIPSEEVRTCSDAPLHLKVTHRQVPEGYHEQRFARWMEYAVFVRKLIIDWTTMTSKERHFLLAKAAKQDLLPNLKVLKISEWFDSDPGWGQCKHLETLKHAEHLTILFVAKSLNTLAMSYRHVSTLNLSFLSTRCPDLRDLRLGYYDSWDEIYRPHPMVGYDPTQPTVDEQALGYILQPRLDLVGGILAWKYLSRLTVYIPIFAAVDFADLGRLPALECLTIFAPNRFPRDDTLDQWVGKQRSFPLLRELTINGCSPEEAKPIFSCDYLLERLQCLCWRSTIWRGYEQDLEEVMQQLAQRAVILEKLHIYTTLTPAALSCWRHLGGMGALSELHLTTHCRGDEEWTIECFFALAKLSRQLKKFALVWPVPISMLPEFAAAFPVLTHLRFLFDHNAWRSSPISVAAVGSPNNVIIEVLHNKGMPMEEDTSLENLER